MATRTYVHAPRRHCPQCAVPDGPPTPSPPALAGQTCTGTMGIDGPICGRPAVELDKHGRPVCDLKYFRNVVAHITGGHPAPTPAALARRDPSSAEPGPPPVARAAQDPPGGEPASSADAAGSDQPLTHAAARELIDDALEAFARGVLGMPATMAQGPGVAVHSVGLCDDGKCAPCRSQRRDEHGQARQLFAGELDLAIEWTGRGKVSEMLARVEAACLPEHAAGPRGPCLHVQGSRHDGCRRVWVRSLRAREGFTPMTSGPPRDDNRRM